MADFGLRRKRAFDRIARAEFGFEGLRRKRAFDRLSIADFGLRRKRAFDRLSGTEFGLVKRSADAPDSARGLTFATFPRNYAVSGVNWAPCTGRQVTCNHALLPMTDCCGDCER